MRTELHTHMTEPLAKVLFAVAALSGGLTLLRIAGFVMTWRDAKGMTAEVVAPNDSDAGGLDAPVAQAKVFAEELNKKTSLCWAEYEPRGKRGIQRRNA